MAHSSTPIASFFLMLRAPPQKVRISRYSQSSVTRSSSRIAAATRRQRLTPRAAAIYWTSGSGRRSRHRRESRNSRCIARD